MLRRRIIFQGLASYRLTARLATVIAVIGLGAGPASAADYIYVSTNGDSIFRYDVSLGTSALVQASGSVFVPAGQGLNRPSGLAFDRSGNLYAANVNSNSITRYDSTGARIGTNFVPAGQGVLQPVGLAFDTSGNLYVANLGDFTMSKYDSAGVLQFSWNTGFLIGPRFLAFPTVVPEPSTYVLGAISTGLMAVIARRRRAV